MSQAQMQNRQPRADETREATQRSWRPQRRWDLIGLLAEVDPSHAYAWRNISMNGETQVIDKRLAEKLRDGEVIVNVADNPVFRDKRIEQSVTVVNGRVTRPGQVLTKFPKEWAEQRREFYRQEDLPRRQPSLQATVLNEANGSVPQGMTFESQDKKKVFQPQ